MGDRFDQDPTQGPKAGGIERARGEGMLDLESVYALLDHPRRRLLLELVMDLDAVTTRDLATQIAAHEHDVSPHEVTDAQRHPVRIALYHVHIPKLADGGVIESKNGMDQIAPGPHAEQVLSALRGLYSEFDVDSEFQRIDCS